MPDGSTTPAKPSLTMIDQALTASGWASLRRTVPGLPVRPPQCRRELQDIWRRTLSSRRRARVERLARRGTDHELQYAVRASAVAPRPLPERGRAAQQRLTSSALVDCGRGGDSGRAAYTPPSSASPHYRFGVRGERSPGSRYTLVTGHPAPLQEHAEHATVCWLATMPASVRAALTARIRRDQANPQQLPAEPREVLQWRPGDPGSLLIVKDAAPSYPRGPRGIAVGGATDLDGGLYSLADLMGRHPQGKRRPRKGLQILEIAYSEMHERFRPRGRMVGRTILTSKGPTIRAMFAPERLPYDGSWVRVVIDVLQCAKLAELAHVHGCAADDPRLRPPPRLVRPEEPPARFRAHGPALLKDIRDNVIESGAEPLPTWADDHELTNYLYEVVSFDSGGAGRVSATMLDSLLRSRSKLAAHIRLTSDRVSKELPAKLQEAARRCFAMLADRVAGVSRWRPSGRGSAQPRAEQIASDFREAHQRASYRTPVTTDDDRNDENKR